MITQSRNRAGRKVLAIMAKRRRKDKSPAAIWVAAFVVGFILLYVIAFATLGVR